MLSGIVTYAALALAFKALNVPVGQELAQFVAGFCSGGVVVKSVKDNLDDSHE